MHRLLTVLIAVASLFALDSLAQQKDPLRVLGMFPKGQLEGANQGRTIIVTFSKPVVPLQQLPEGDGSGPLVIAPAVKGKFRWLGTSTLSFTPSDTLEPATEYHVKLAANFKASDGTSLGGDVTWSFTTARPALIASSPGHNQQSVQLTPTIFLRFTQKMNPAKAASFIKVKEGTREGSAVAFTVGVPGNEELSKAKVYWSSDTTMMLALRLEKPLVKNKRYVVMLAKELPGARGTLGMEKEASFAFDTYRDFAFVRVDNPTNRRPGDGLTFNFTTPVRFRDLVNNLSFDPPVKPPENYEEYEWSAAELTLYLQLKAETKYTCTIKKELQDIFGQTLGKDATFTITTSSHEPYFTMTSGHGILEAYGDRVYPVTTMNLSSVEVKMLRLNKDNVIPMLTS
ncbi:MAG: Ig-like domain-containing protein, partial [Ignavibacteriae bacterium]|nr:Ig-like domain-containing protein [Ignavibacteriota bacterium]